jgi:hypothetical protein
MPYRLAYRSLATRLDWPIKHPEDKRLAPTEFVSRESNSAFGARRHERRETGRARICSAA